MIILNFKIVDKNRFIIYINKYSYKSHNKDIYFDKDNTLRFQTK